MYQANGNTYPVKDYLKKCGLTFCPTSKKWIGSDFNFDMWNKQALNPTYSGRKIARLAESVKIEKVEF